jgi:glycosyltransferase involved in cell wall biosynthesis
MAAGVPCICTRIGITDEMVTDGVDGFIVPQKDSDAIAARLRELADDPGRLAEMKRAAKAASAKFDVRATARQLADLFGIE